MQHPSPAWQATLTEVEGVELERELATSWACARQEWPMLDLKKTVFSAFMVQHISGMDELAKVRASDLYIACACVHGINGAVEAFQTRWTSKLRSAIRSWSPSSDQATEIEQQCWDTLFVAKPEGSPALASYAGRGSLQNFVRSIATRTARRVVLAESKRQGLSSDIHDELVCPKDDPEIEALKLLYREEFALAFRDALTSLSARQRNLLRQSFIDGLSIDQLGTLYRIHRATAARWLAASRAALLKGTKENLSAAVGATDSTVDSIIRLVHSQLDFSIHQFFS